MKLLSEIFDSLLKSYNNNETINFIDIRDLEEIIPNSKLIKSLINSYNNREKINFRDLRDLENLIK